MLTVRHLHKRYAVPVLQGIDLEIGKGDVHALVGANGAGKTTLCNIISGVTTADSGAMQFQGRAHTPTSVADAEAAGIRIVMQELNLIDNLSVAENLYFGALPTRYGLIDIEQLHDNARRVLGDMGLAGIDPAMPVRALGIGQQQLIEIGRELIHPCELLILDEPTAALTGPEIDLLFEKIAALKALGTAVIYVSHRMDEIRRIADHLSVLKDGRIVLRSPVADVSTDDIIKSMTDELVTRPPDAQAAVSELPIALQVRGLSTRDRLRDVDLDIRCGEVLGIGGLMGSGRTELLRAIFAADALSAGRLFVEDTPLSFNGPIDAVAFGIGLIPEDRKRLGLLLQQSVRANVTLASLGRFGRFAGWIDDDEEREAVEHFRAKLDIKSSGIDQVVAQLSGGNQQKVSIARWLMRDCRILLFDEPTRGIDIHAKTAIYSLLRDLANAGRSVVMVSSESRELTQLCDRIAVMSNGRLAATFDRGEWTNENIMAASFSGYVDDSAA